MSHHAGLHLRPSADLFTGEKMATVRYDDERRPVPGDVITASIPDGEEVAWLQVTLVARTSIDEAIPLFDAVGAEHGSATSKELRQTLSSHYPDAELDGRHRSDSSSSP